ncbi:MAG TPA: IPT/TIG domain-containing protein, partial [Acidimicrobiales bacterium]|nr:IPT/TIG domain-containing protein [Acidimicrobiales bacterium]
MSRPGVMLRVAGAAAVLAAVAVAWPGAPSPAEAAVVPGGFGIASICPTPVVSSVLTGDGQQAAPPGATVYIHGTNLSASVCTTGVTLGGVAVTAVPDPAGLQFDMPAGAAGGPLQVKLSDALGNAAASTSDHVFVALPVVDHLSPSSPAAGAPLGATGHGFALAGLPGAAATVSYCGRPAQAATIESDTTLRLPGPAAPCSGPAVLAFTATSLYVGVPAGTVSIGAAAPPPPTSPQPASEPSGGAGGGVAAPRGGPAARGGPAPRAGSVSDPGVGPHILAAGTVTNPPAAERVPIRPTATGAIRPASVLGEAPGPAVATVGPGAAAAAPQAAATLSPSTAVPASISPRPRPLPLPMAMMAATLLALVAAAYVLTLQKGGRLLLPSVDAPIVWRVGG